MEGKVEWECGFASTYAGQAFRCWCFVNFATSASSTAIYHFHRYRCWCEHDREPDCDQQQDFLGDESLGYTA
jgi:hypothetical protein